MREMEVQVDMRTHFSLSAVSCLILLSVSGMVSPVSAQDVFVTPISNAPFSGVINVERAFVQRDGSVANLKTFREIGRDSKGRIYNEVRMLLPVSSRETPRVMSILVYDPESRTSTTLRPQQQTFSRSTVNRPPATAPPALLDASSAGNSLPQNQFTRQEDLGIHEIEGVPAHGVRETQTIRAENAGQEIVVTDEFWYSEDLRINLVIRHHDPRTGSVTLAVQQIKRTEPDPARFEIPEGYKRAGLER